jgi:hypothetical protein
MIDNIDILQIFFAIFESILILMCKNIWFGELLLVYPFITTFDIISFFTIFKLSTLNIFLIRYLER